VKTSGRDIGIPNPSLLRDERPQSGAREEQMESDPPAADAADPLGQDGDARLQLAIEEAGLATWDTDFIAGESTWSPNHFRLFGYPVDPRGRASLEMWSSRLHPGDRQRALAELERAKREHTLYRSEYRIVRADTGDVAWIEPRGRFVYDAAGRATHLVGVCLETTMRKHAEERLVWREEQLALATRLVGIGVFDHDHLENRLYWSQQFRQIHDMPPHIAPQLELLDAQTHADDREPLRAAVRAAHDPTGDGQFSFEYRIRRSDGEVRWIVARARTIFIGEGADRHAVRTVGAELDVTDRHLADARLRDSEARFRTMADGSPVMIWAMDRFGAIEFVNKAFREFFGVTPERVRHDGWRGLLHPDDAARYMDAYKDAVAKRAQFRAQARVRSGNGDWRWIESYATPRVGPIGQFLGYVGVSPDVTALMEAQDALRQADERKDQFLATLAHELRNPLAPIRVAAEILTLPTLNEEHLSWSRQVIQMARLLDDLLDVARITRGKLQLKKQPVDLSTVVDTAVEAARPLIKARTHGLTVDLPPELPTLDADPVRLAQILSNLLTNAAKYTDSPGSITLAARAEGAMLRISVKDNGIGLSPSVLAHIFEMFSQGHEDGDRAEGGLGIGLALVKGIVDLHGGSIEAFSDGPGFGSEFVVMLPCHAADTMRAAPAPSASKPRGTIVPRKILIADDNEDAANTLAMLLKLAGHDVCTAHSGLAALALASNFRPDIALLDIGMPDVDGYEVAKGIRETTWGRDVCIVALTGWGQEEDKRRARAAGFDHHLTKPVDPRDLDELVASSISADASHPAEGSYPSADGS
jgi:PAS domain S-box-containing protein